MKIVLNHSTYSLHQIVNNPPSGNFTDFERSLWFFIQEWQSGKNQFIQSTSGSTGIPKEIKLSRAKMQLSAKRTIDFFNLKQGNTALVCISTAFIGGKMMLVRALENRMNIIAVEPSSNPLQGIDESIHFAAMVPLQLFALLKDQNQVIKLNKLKALILGGSPVSAQLESEVNRLKVPVYETYGMTETVSHIALRKLNGTDKKAVFHTLPGTKVLLNDSGCLVVHSDVAIEEEIVTNDLAEVFSTDKFKILGRADQVINSGGVKINLLEIEKLLERYFQNQGFSPRFICIGIPDDKLGQKLVLVIESSQKINIPDLKHSGIDDPFKIPREVYFLDRFEETPTSKIQRSASLTKLKLSRTS